MMRHGAWPAAPLVESDDAAHPPVNVVHEYLAQLVTALDVGALAAPRTLTGTAGRIGRNDAREGASSSPAISDWRPIGGVTADGALEHTSRIRGGAAS